MANILIIEDDPIATKVYTFWLKKEGHCIEIARDSDSGLEQVFSGWPEIVLLDLLFPKYGGVVLLQRIREIPHFKDLPVIALTNAYTPALIQQAIEAGANHVFNKSQLTPVILLEAVRNLLAPNKKQPTSSR